MNEDYLNRMKSENERLSKLIWSLIAKDSAFGDDFSKRIKKLIYKSKKLTDLQYTEELNIELNRQFTVIQSLFPFLVESTICQMNTSKNLKK